MPARFPLIADITLDLLPAEPICPSMRYDLHLLNEFCLKLGLRSHLTDQSSLEVSLGDETVLCFQNAELDEDCLMGFAGTPWHTHGDLMFSDRHGHFVELDPLNLLTGLGSGDVLVCDQEVGGSLVDRWLVHKIFNDEFVHLMPNERLIIRRAGFANAPRTESQRQPSTQRSHSREVQRGERLEKLKHKQAEKPE